MVIKSGYRLYVLQLHKSDRQNTSNVECKLENEGWIRSNHRNFYKMKYTHMTSIVEGSGIAV